MKAKIVEQKREARQEWNKEKINYWHVMVTHKGEIINPVTAYCWMGKSRDANVVYAGIWVHGRNKETSGRGKAGGYGYHKESAAMQAAITSAGIELYGSPYADEMGMLSRNSTGSGEPEPEDLKKRAYIDGVGDRAIKSALVAITRAAGYRGKLVIQ